VSSRLSSRLLLGPCVTALLCLTGVWWLIRPEVGSSIRQAQRFELHARLYEILRDLDRLPVTASASFDGQGWMDWFRGHSVPPLKVALLENEPAPTSAPPARLQPAPSLFPLEQDPQLGLLHVPGGAFELVLRHPIRLAGRPALLQISLPDQAVEGSARSALWMSAFILVAALLGIGLTWLDARRIAGALVDLHQMIRRIRRHEFDSRMSIEGEQELRMLQLEANTLARTLQLELVDLDGTWRRLWGVLEGMTEGVLVTDRAGTIILTNRSLAKILRYHGPAIGRTLLEVYRNVDLASAMERVQSSREPVTRELELRFPETRFVVVRLSCWGDVREPGGVVAVLHDVTEMRRLEQVRRDFVANASHELRTPVAAIRGYAEALLDGEPLPEESRSFVEVIERNARRLTALVDDILALARIESPTYHLDMTAVDLSDSALTVVRALATLADERRITVFTELASDLPKVNADRGALEHVLTNLIENALKYTPPGGQVVLRGRQDEQWVLLEVSDSGVGIPPEELPRIFERFYRVDSARSRAVGGTGLGLAIVKHLVHAMEGELSVKSTYGSGSVFTVMLQRHVPESLEAK